MTDDNTPYDPYQQKPLPEGEEGTPPLTHAMSIVRWVILIGISAFALVMVLSYFGISPWAKESGGTVQYHCPMHPTYVSNKPGECPICGMSLVPIDADTTMAGMAQPREPEIRAESTNVKVTRYTCPMHPEVISDKPGECPQCGMDLVPMDSSMENMGRQSQAVPAEAKEPSMPSMDMGQAPVPGLVPLTLEPRRLQLIDVRTARVEKQPMGNSIRLFGYVTPDEARVANLNLRVSGWVQKLYVNQTGQTVDRGEPLLTVYSQDLYQGEQDYLLALDRANSQTSDSALAGARLRLLDAAREKLLLLGLTDDEISKLKSSGQAQVEIPLRSPFRGVVLNKAVLVGQFVNPEQSLFTIADLSRVWVLADVYESDLAAVRVGLKVKVSAVAFPGEQFDGVVSFIYPTISEPTRTLKIRVEFPNPEMKLRPGMYARVELEGNPQQVIAVPREAVMQGGDIDYVFVVHDGNHFEPRQVKLGRSTDSLMEVLSGVSDGETVVTSANFLIDSESRLKAAVSGMGDTPGGEHAGHIH